MTTITNELDSMHMEMVLIKAQVDEVTKTCTDLWRAPPQEFFDKNTVLALTKNIQEGLRHVRNIMGSLTTMHPIATAMRRTAPPDKQEPTKRMVREMDSLLGSAKNWMVMVQGAHVQLLNEMAANILGITVEELERTANEPPMSLAGQR